MKATTMLPKKPTLPVIPNSELSRNPPMIAPATPTRLEEAARDLAVDERIAPVGGDDFRNSRDRPRVDFVVERKPGRDRGEDSGSARLPGRDFDVQLERWAREDESFGARQPARAHGAQHHHAAKRVAEGDDLPGGLAFHVSDESRRVIDPSRPRVDVAPLPCAFAVSAEVDRVGGHLEPRHPAGESLVPPAVLAQAMHHRESDLCGRLRPRSYCESGAIGRVD